MRNREELLREQQRIQGESMWVEWLASYHLGRVPEGAPWGAEYELGEPTLEEGWRRERERVGGDSGREVDGSTGQGQDAHELGKISCRITCQGGAGEGTEQEMAENDNGKGSRQDVAGEGREVGEGRVSGTGTGDREWEGRDRNDAYDESGDSEVESVVQEEKVLTDHSKAVLERAIQGLGRSVKKRDFCPCTKLEVCPDEWCGQMVMKKEKGCRECGEEKGQGGCGNRRVDSKSKGRQRSRGRTRWQATSATWQICSTGG